MIKNKVKQIKRGNKKEERWITNKKKTSEITLLILKFNLMTNIINSTMVIVLLKKYKYENIFKLTFERRLRVSS